MFTSIIDPLKELISLQRAIHWSHPTASGFSLYPQQLSRPCKPAVIISNDVFHTLLTELLTESQIL